MPLSGGALGRSVSLRFLLLCLAISLVCTVPVLWFASREAEQILVADFTGRLERRRANLEEHYENGGMALLRAKIRDRIERGLVDAGAILLVDAGGRKVEGNIAGWPDGVAEREGWQTVDLAMDGAAQPHAHRAAVTQLSNGHRLLVTGLLDDRDEIRSSLWQAMLSALLLAVAMAIAGSLVIRRHLDRMVDVVAQTANNIADGKLSQRAPRNYSVDPLDRISASLNRILDRIEGLIGENRMMTDALAHDLRTPLTRISTSLEQASRGNGHKAPGALPAIGREVGLMLRMIDDTMEISRAEAGIGRENFEYLDLADVLEGLHDMYLPLAQMQGIAFTLACESGLTLHCNRSLMTRSIANLIDNAFKHGIAGREITLGGHVAGGKAIVSVADRGEGIPVHLQGEAMQKFRRLSAARSLPGMGVGLALVAAIARLHNGELQLDDNRPGLVARLVLAITPAATATAAAVAAGATKTAGTTPDGGGISASVR